MAITTWLMGALLGAAAIDDLLTKKVHNWLSIGFLVLSIVVVHLLGFGNQSISESLLSFAYILGMSLPLVILKVWGAGDMKLLLALSPMILPDQVFAFIAWTMIWGVVMGLNKLLVAYIRTGKKQKEDSYTPYTIAFIFAWLTLNFSSMGSWI